MKKIVYLSFSIDLLVKQIIPAFTKIAIKEINSRIVYQIPILRALFGNGRRVTFKSLNLST